MKPNTPSIAKPTKPLASKIVVGIVVLFILCATGFGLWKLLPTIQGEQAGSDKPKPTAGYNDTTVNNPSSDPLGGLTMEEPRLGPNSVNATPLIGEPLSEPSPDPILVTPKNEEVPAGFGLAPDQDFLIEEDSTNPNPNPNPDDQGLVDLNPLAPTQEQKAPEPATPVAPPAEPEPAEETVDTADPRSVGITTNDGPDKEYEETSLTVQRTLTAVSGEKKQLIRLKVPVMYQSRTMRLEGENLDEAKRIQGELAAKAAELASIKVEMETLLKDWNNLVEKSTPQDVLLPESPTLPQNQSANPLNREEDDVMTPGKSITFEVLDN